MLRGGTTLEGGAHLYLAAALRHACVKVSSDSCACGRVSWSSSSRSSSSWYSASCFHQSPYIWIVCCRYSASWPWALRLVGLVRLLRLLLLRVVSIVVFAFCGFALLVLVLSGSRSRSCPHSHLRWESHGWCVLVLVFIIIIICIMFFFMSRVAPPWRPALRPRVAHILFIPFVHVSVLVLFLRSWPVPLGARNLEVEFPLCLCAVPESGCT